MLDTSALLALVQREPGAEVVHASLADAAMCSVNLAEAITVLVRKGRRDFEAIQLEMASLDLDLIDFDEDLAVATGMLFAQTKPYRLSLGDRACLAAAVREAVPVMTTERSWGKLDLGIDIQLIR
jgi:PIN domain nuclease of toxin-antitoxin system